MRKMKLEKKRWFILAASCLINLCIGSLYAWSVFAGPMAAHISQAQGLAGDQQLTAATLAVVFTVANAVGPITMIGGGFINDSLGPRWGILLGGLLFGGGLILSGFANSLGMLTMAYGLGCGLGMGCVYTCTINNSVKLFPDKRGLIGGIATATYGLSSVIIPPIAQKLIVSGGVLSAFRILGITFTVIIFLCAFLIEKAPQGFVPAGMAGQKKQAAAGAPDQNWRQMLSQSSFYVMFLMLMCGAFSGLMIISQASPMAQKMIGMEPAQAAVAVSLLALFNAMGRVLAGYLSDKLGRIQVIRIVFLISIVGLFFLTISGQGQTLLFMSGVSIAGICFGAFMGVFPGFTADRFGARYNSVNYGIMFTGFALAGTVGPLVAGRIVLATGSYQMAFVAAGVLGLLGFVMTFVYRRIVKA